MKGLELLFDIPADIPRSLIGDPLRLGQILIQPGQYAVKFTEQNIASAGTTVRRSHPGRLNCNLLYAIPAQVCYRTDSHLFQAFTQMAHFTCRFGGTGLG